MYLEFSDFEQVLIFTLVACSAVIVFALGFIGGNK